MKHLPKWFKQIVANHYFYQWARTKNERDLNLYLIWSE